MFSALDSAAVDMLGHKKEPKMSNVFQSLGML